MQRALSSIAATENLPALIDVTFPILI